MTAPELYFHAKKIFECNNIESASFEAMCILEHVFGKKLSVLLLEKPTASEEQKNTVNNLAYRRICGYPLQYLVKVQASGYYRTYIHVLLMAGIISS